MITPRPHIIFPGGVYPMRSTIDDIKSSLCQGGIFSRDQDHKLRDALEDIERRRKSTFLSWRRNMARYYLLLRTFLQEFRSFLARIQIVRKRRPYLVPFGPAIELLPNGHRQPCRRTHACMRDRENFFSSRPWATLVDVEIFVAAWNMGAEWRADISDSCNSERLDS